MSSGSGRVIPDVTVRATNVQPIAARTAGVVPESSTATVTSRPCQRVRST
jgi:hypothetical protein